MKEMLALCTKNVHFTFSGVIDVQTDRVALGSSLGQVLAGIFMVHLERFETLTNLKDQLSFGMFYYFEKVYNYLL